MYCMTTEPVNLDILKDKLKIKPQIQNESPVFHFKMPVVNPTKIIYEPDHGEIASKFMSKLKQHGTLGVIHKYQPPVLDTDTTSIFKPPVVAEEEQEQKQKQEREREEQKKQPPIAQPIIKPTAKKTKKNSKTIRIDY